MIRVRSLAVFGTFAIAACADSVPSAPAPSALTRVASTASASSDDNVEVSSVLADMNAQLAAAGADYEIAKAELIVDVDGWDAASSTVLIANDRARGIGVEWVNRDPRRGGQPGLTYAIASHLKVQPVTRDPDGSNVRLVSFAQLDTQLEEGTAAWRDQQCSDAPLTRAAIVPGTNPDQLDDVFSGRPVLNYRRAADIVQGGWMPSQFFRNFAGPAGNNIIGVTFTFRFVGPNGPTDIDNNGKFDAALSEVYYNTRFFWGTTEARNVIDFYSIITHETGHAVGLGHFGKVFVTAKDASDGISLADIKYAPKAMMNAVYVTGRSSLEGTDNSSFCQIWASKN